ncbi:MAG: alpha-amylase/4-alpha-glucanotransferase domain-containing protein [Pirellulales bacterium]
MTHRVHLSLVLHNHQPVGNFDGVFEQAYRDGYLPFLDLFEQYPSLRIGLHTSGPLMEWLDAHYPEYLDRLAALVAEGRVEILGGAFYEPILTMIPSRDRIGQIRTYSRWLENRLGATIQGMWIAERVWEPGLTADLVDAGIRYTLLDDSHFKSAGLVDDQLGGYYVTEDDGRVLLVFPGDERLRYIIPFDEPQRTIDHLGELAARHPGAVAVFADDGEKFGSWPETHRHVYENGWLRRLFDLLVENQSWIHVTTPADVLDRTSPLGKIYLPTASYREMTEWVLPAEQQNDYLASRHALEHDSRWPHVAPFVRGGFWRNFKVKYNEANEMYARMMAVSTRLQAAIAAGASGETIDHARTELYRGQCNCAYWHGAFGGIYLPHLRNAVFNHLIAADNLLDQAAGRTGPWVEADVGDWNFDARQEVRMAGDRLSVLLAPSEGGQMTELDVRTICHNLLATLTRRPEAYHGKLLYGQEEGEHHAAVIKDRVVCKQDGLDALLRYDAYPRKSLIDHFYSLDATREAVEHGEADELGDFVHAPYEARLRRNPDRIQVQMARAGSAAGHAVRVTKGVTLAAGGSALEIAYLLEGLPPGQPLLFAAEFNVAGLPSGADDRYFHGGEGERFGQLGARLDLADATRLHLVDEWLGIDVGFDVNRPTGFWTFPIESVSQSEGGFEGVHQSVVVLPHWRVLADEHGRWSVQVTLTADTSLAESRMENAAIAVTV